MKLGSRKAALLRQEALIDCPVPLISPENVHTGTLCELNRLYFYNTCMHVITIDEKEVVNLKESEKQYKGERSLKCDLRNKSPSEITQLNVSSCICKTHMIS